MADTIEERAVATDHTYVPVDVTAYGDPEPVELGRCGHVDPLTLEPDCGLPEEAHASWEAPLP